jgi:hypothetical protein
LTLLAAGNVRCSELSAAATDRERDPAWVAGQREKRADLDTRLLIVDDEPLIASA